MTFVPSMSEWQNLHPNWPGGRWGDPIPSPSWVDQRHHSWTTEMKMPLDINKEIQKRWGTEQNPIVANMNVSKETHHRIPSSPRISRHRRSNSEKLHRPIPTYSTKNTTPVWNGDIDTCMLNGDSSTSEWNGDMPTPIWNGDIDQSFTTSTPSKQALQLYKAPKRDLRKISTEIFRPIDIHHNIQRRGFDELQQPLGIHRGLQTKWGMDLHMPFANQWVRHMSPQQHYEMVANQIKDSKKHMQQAKQQMEDMVQRLG